MGTDTEPQDTQQRQPLSEAVQDRPPKPPLGPPHDAFATICLAACFAAGLFFSGYGRTENDWIGWTGLIVSLGATVLSLHYFIRAYGFRTKGWQEGIPTGAYFALFFGFFFTFSLVAPAIYSGYAGQSTIALVGSLVAVSALPVAGLRAALGKAPHPPAAAA